MISLLHVIAFCGYALAAGVLARSFALGQGTAPRTASLSSSAAFTFHLLALIVYAMEYGEPPLVGLPASLSTLAAIIAAMQVIALSRKDARPVGLVLAPLVALLVGAAALLGVQPEGQASAFRGPWLAVHVLAAFVGYAALAVAFAAALLYLIQFRALKDRHFGRIFAFFPPLATLDRLIAGAITAGFPALTLALFLGWAWTLRFRNSLDPGNPQVIWGVLTWLVFASMILTRRRGSGSERVGAVVAVVGFAIVVIAYLALRLGAAAAGGFL